MIRESIGVNVGYITITLVVLAALTIAWLTLGADLAFAPTVYQLSTLWAALTVAVNIIAAIAGGSVCAALSRTTKTPVIFAIIVFTLGVLVAIPALPPRDESPPAPRPDRITMSDALTNGRQPRWVVLSIPVTVAAGILLGAALMRTWVRPRSRA